MSMERYACGAYACGEVRPLVYEFLANFSKLALNMPIRQWNNKFWANIKYEEDLRYLRPTNKNRI